MVYIIRKLEDGQLVPIACRRNLQEAQDTIDAMKNYWPGEYLVQTTDQNERTDRTPCA